MFFTLCYVASLYVFVLVVKCVFLFKYCSALTSALIDNIEIFHWETRASYAFSLLTRYRISFSNHKLLYVFAVYEMKLYLEIV